LNKKDLKNLGGFVTQDDIMLPFLTVEETIRFSARLRLPKSVDRSEIEPRVCGQIIC
jgi:ABC-type multidrug transport system ATPase subunit